MIITNNFFFKILWSQYHKIFPMTQIAFDWITRDHEINDLIDVIDYARISAIFVKAWFADLILGYFMSLFSDFSIAR